jgi:hypothetical protein
MRTIGSATRESLARRPVDERSAMDAIARDSGLDTPEADEW